MKPTLHELWVAYCANLGRQPVQGEGAEFSHKFADADTEILRRAIDEYFGTVPPPEFPKLPGLHAVYQRLNGDRLVAAKQAQERAARNAEAAVTEQERHAALAPFFAKRRATP